MPLASWLWLDLSDVRSVSAGASVQHLGVWPATFCAHPLVDVALGSFAQGVNPSGDCSGAQPGLAPDISLGARHGGEDLGSVIFGVVGHAVNRSSWGIGESIALPVYPMPLDGVILFSFKLNSIFFIMKTITKNCKFCDQQFTKRDNGNPHTFCSRECGGKWHMQNRVMRGPSLAGNTLRKGCRPTNAFTTEQVSGTNNPKWKEGICFTCEHCNLEFSLKPWEVKQRGGNARFCSRECFTSSSAFLGEKSKSWVGGQVTYRGRGWLKARQLAVERDNGTCAVCEKITGQSISVHHIQPYRDFESSDQANRLQNLVCLCQSCHLKHERIAPALFLGILLRAQYQYIETPQE